MCDYSDVYIAGKGTIDLEVARNNSMTQKGVIFKNNVPFRSCISKIDNTFIENAENLDVVMPMYNLIEYCDNYSMTSGTLWNYYRDEVDDVDDNASDGKSFMYKTK